MAVCFSIRAPANAVMAEGESEGPAAAVWSCGAACQQAVGPHTHLTSAERELCLPASQLHVINHQSTLKRCLR